MYVSVFVLEKAEIIKRHNVGLCKAALLENLYVNVYTDLTFYYVELDVGCSK